jgi:hypothetical protein
MRLYNLILINFPNGGTHLGNIATNDFNALYITVKQLH